MISIDELKNENMFAYKFIGKIYHIVDHFDILVVAIG
jgi:hypothetical protein